MAMTTSPALAMLMLLAVSRARAGASGPARPAAECQLLQLSSSQNSGGGGGLWQASGDLQAQGSDITSTVWPTLGGKSASCCHCNWVMRVRLPGANLPAGPQQLRFKFAQSNNGIAYAAFGEEESAGVMKAGTITNLCFDGQVGDCTTAVSTAAQERYTEWFDYTIDATKNYYVSYLHLCGPGGSSSGTTPDGVAFSGYPTSSSDYYTYWSTSAATTWYNDLRSSGLAATLRGPDALVYGQYSRDPGASIAGGWTSMNRVEGIEGVETQASSGGSSGGAGASAVGDPHLTNIHGQRFDLAQPGTHALLQIPGGAAADATLLGVSALASQMGAHCADMYFQEVNISGKWAEIKQAGGFRFLAGEVGNGKEANWATRLGPVDLKVVHGSTLQGIPYLNFFVQHLGQVESSIGGLLGSDDHTEAATPTKKCGRSMSLVDGQAAKDSSSVAEASLA